MEVKFISQVSGVQKLNTPIPQQPAGRVNEATVATTKTESDTTQELGVSAAELTAKEISAAGQTKSDEALGELVDNLNQQVQSNARSLQFSVDENNGRPIVSVIDKETDTVIRQIPAEVALQIADALEQAAGALVSEHA